MRRVTIVDIVRDTGLSRGTISRALNNRPDISPETRRRVLESCRKLHYVPSHAARSLATGRNYAVAALVDDLRSALAADFLRGALGRAAEAQYAVQILDLGRDPPPERLQALSANRVDAVLNAVPLGAAAARELRRLLGNRPLASCWPLADPRCDVLTPDDLEAGRMVARFLIRAGLRALLYIQRDADPGAGRRLAGFQAICRESGLDADAATVLIPDLKALDTLDSRMRDAEAIATSDDFLAVAVMLRCAALGRRAGADLAIVGCGNEPVTGAIHPSVTTVDFDGEEIGRRAMETLLQRLDGQRADRPQHLQTAPKLVRRDSTRHLEHGQR